MNTSHLNGKISGIGGFTDISSMSKKIIFMGTFTASGLKAEVGNGKITILQEVKIKKYIRNCAKRSFVAERYLKEHENYLIITERCVVERTREGMVLKEIAPVIDIKTQILDQSDVDFIIPEGGPALMESSIFTEYDFNISAD